MPNKPVTTAFSELFTIFVQCIIICVECLLHCFFAVSDTRANDRSRGVCIFSWVCIFGQGVCISAKECTKKEAEPQGSTSISLPPLNLNTILPSRNTVALSIKATHSLSSHSSRTRGCFFRASMNSRISRS